MRTQFWDGRTQGYRDTCTKVISIVPLSPTSGDKSQPTLFRISALPSVSVATEGITDNRTPQSKSSDYLFISGNNGSDFGLQGNLQENKEKIGHSLKEKQYGLLNSKPFHTCNINGYTLHIFLICTNTFWQVIYTKLSYL